MGSINKISQLVFQNEFSENEKKRIRYIYSNDLDEKILCGIYLNKFFRKGFVLTDKNIYWNIGFNSKNDFGKIEKHSENPVDFSITDIIPEEEKDVLDDYISKLTIKNNSQEKNLFFYRLNENKKNILLETLKIGYIQDETLKNNPDVYIRKTSKIQDVIDMGLNSFSLAKKRFQKKKNSTKLEQEQKKQQKKKLKEEKLKLKKEQNSTFTLSDFFAHFFDIIASLVFIAAVIIALKPELLNDSPLNGTPFVLTETIGNYFLQVKLTSTPVATEARNLWVTIFLSSFFLLKFVVIFISKNSKKFVAFLMILLSLLSCWIVADKFLLFILFCLVIYFAFEILCNYSFKIILNKILIIVFFSILFYFLSHIILMDNSISKLFKDLSKALKNLFIQFSLPILWW